MARPKLFDDDAVLDEALQLFWERGYDAVSIAELEARLGVGRQSLYNVFGDKRELFRRALARYAGKGAEAGQRLLTPEAGLAGIRAYFVEVAAFLGTAGRERGCFVANSRVREAEDDPAVASQCEAVEGALARRLRAALQAARRRGEVAADLDVDAGVRALLAHWYGLSVLAAGGATRPQLEAATGWLLDRLG